MVTVYRVKSDKVYLEDNRSDYTLVDVSTLPRSKTRSKSIHAAVKPKIVSYYIKTDIINNKCLTTTHMISIFFLLILFSI